MSEELSERSLSDRVVLLGVARLAGAGETPAHTGRVVRACNEDIETIEADTLGSVSEAEANRTLNRLEAEGYVEANKSDDTSAVGKGRPQYALVDDPESVVDDLLDDEEVSALAAQVRDSL